MWRSRAKSTALTGPGGRRHLRDELIEFKPVAMVAGFAGAGVVGTHDGPVRGEACDDVGPVGVRAAAGTRAEDAELDIGHLGLLEQPDLVAATIRRFLESTAAPWSRR